MPSGGLVCGMCAYRCLVRRVTHHSSGAHRESWCLFRRMKPPRPALTGRGPTSIIVANTYGEDDTLAAKDARPPSRNLDAARLLSLYRTMLRIRAFEEAALEGLEDKLVLGAIHPSIGQEAVAVGVCAN